MLDQEILKAAANKCEMKITFGSDKPGFYSASDNKFYSFSDLEKLIDDLIGKGDEKTMSEKNREKVFDVKDKEIKEYDVCRNVTTGEMMLVTKGTNMKGETKLYVENNIIGLGDWLDVYPDGELEVLGNAAISYE